MRAIVVYLGFTPGPTIWHEFRRHAIHREVTYMKTVAKHYINGQFVESHGRESLDLISPTTERIIGRVILGDEQDTRDAIRAAKEAFKTFSKTSVDMRARYLQALHDSVIARADEHIAIMVEEYGGVYQFSNASARRAAQTGWPASRTPYARPVTPRQLPRARPNLPS